MVLTKRHINVLLSSILLSLSLIAIVPSGSVSAISGDGLIAYPTNPDPQNPLTESWFIYSLNPGESKRDSLTLKNDSDKQQTVRIYAVDSTTNNVGEFALKSENDPKENIGKWISLESDSVTLQPKEKKEIGFTIAIPQDVKPGEISGGIILQKELTDEQKNAKSGFIITTRIGIRVYETVPGETVEKLSFGESWVEYDESAKAYVLNVNIKNESSMSVEPEVKVEVKDLFFNKQGDSITKKIQIPRGGQVRMSFPLYRSKFGQFEVSSSLSYGKDKVISLENPQKVTFWALPWDIMTLLALLILMNIIFVIIVKLLSRRENRFRKEYAVADGENLEIIAGKFSMSWKKIAKINHIKPPYQLAPGDIITVIDKQNVLGIQSAEKDLAWKDNIAEKPVQEWENWTEEKPTKGKVSKNGKKALILIAVVVIAAAAFMAYSAMTIKKPAENQTNKPSVNQIDQAASDQADSSTKGTQENAQSTDETQKSTSSENSDSEGQKPEGEQSAAEIQPLTTQDRSQIKIEILNGSGIKGASAKLVTALTAKGYANMTAGNADNFNHTTTLLEYGTGTDKRIVKEIESAITADYQNEQSSENAELASGSIRVTLGK